MKKFLVTLLIIILVAVIGVGGYFLYQLNEKIDNLSAEKEEPATNNEVVNNVTPVEPTTNTVVENNVVEPTEPSQTTTLTETEALEIGEELYDYAGEAYWGAQTFEYEENEEGYLKRVEVEGYGDLCIILNYAEVMEKFTAKGEKEICDYRPIINKDNQYLSDNTLARGSNISYIGTELTVKDIQEDVITFEAKSSYCELTTEGRNEDVISEVKTEDFIIKKENGKWKVDEFTLPN